MSSLSINAAYQTAETTTVTTQTKPQTKTSTPPASGSSSDGYKKTSTPKENIKLAMSEGTLTYKAGEKFLWGLIERKAQYTYQASGRETIADIRAKFGLQDGALRKCNSYINDAEWVPEKGKLIFFNEEDIIQ